MELDEDGLPPLLSASDVDDEVPLNVLREQGYEAFMEASLTNLTSHEAALDQRETLTMPVELALTEPTGASCFIRTAHQIFTPHVLPARKLIEPFKARSPGLRPSRPRAMSIETRRSALHAMHEAKQCHPFL